MAQRQLSPQFLNRIVLCQDRDEVNTLVRNTTTYTTVFQSDILPFTLGTEKSLRLKMFGDCFNQTGVDRDITIRWYYGSTTLSTSAFTIPNDANKRAVKFEGTLMGQEDLAIQRSVTEVMIGAPNTAEGTSAVPAFVHLCTKETVNEDSTEIQSMYVDIELSAASVSLLFNFWGATLEIV